MEGHPGFATSFAALLLACMASGGCATRHAPDFAGRWQVVNRYAVATEAIPLQHVHVFRASPMDGTLKTMLARWARDAAVALDYRHPSDFTLHAPVQRIRSQRLDQAAAQVTAIYAPQQVHVSLQDGRLVVARAAQQASGMP